MADPIPVLIDGLGLRGTFDGSELIPNMRESETVALAGLLDDMHLYRFHALDRPPTAADNTAAGYGNYHFWIDTNGPTLYLKTAEAAGSATWTPAGGGGGSGAATALVETSGPDTLTVGDVLDGQMLRRVGSTIVGDSGQGLTVEAAVGANTLSAADNGKVFLAGAGFTLTLPANLGAGVQSRVVNTASAPVTITGGDGASLVPGTLELQPGNQVSIYTAGDAVWFLVVSPSYQEEYMTVALGDETTAVEELPDRITFRAAFPMTITRLRASFNEAPSGGPAVFDVNVDGASILSTKLTVESGSTTSVGAAVPAVIGDGTVPDDAEISVDLDLVGEVLAGAGPKLTIYYVRN